MKTVVDAQAAEEAVRAIEMHAGDAVDFVLRVRQSVFVPMNADGRTVTGVHAALITDAALKRGWWPDGVLEDGDFKVYKYVE